MEEATKPPTIQIEARAVATNPDPVGDILAKQRDNGQLKSDDSIQTNPDGAAPPGKPLEASTPIPPQEL